MIDIGFILAIVFGVIIGFNLAWANFCWHRHRSYKVEFPNKQIPVSLLLSRIISILFGMVLPLISIVILLKNWPTLLNAITYGCTIVVAIFGVWRFIFKEKLPSPE